MLLLAAGVVSVLMFWRFWETEEETEEQEELEPEPIRSWGTCAGSKLLEEDISSDLFGTKSDPCVLAEGELPFSIMVYRSSSDFFDRIGDRRPIYIDEIESDSALKAKALQFLTDATS